jgi:hypothetical protein
LIRFSHLLLLFSELCASFLFPRCSPLKIKFVLGAPEKLGRSPAAVETGSMCVCAAARQSFEYIKPWRACLQEFITRRYTREFSQGLYGALLFKWKFHLN